MCRRSGGAGGGRRSGGAGVAGGRPGGAGVGRRSGGAVVGHVSVHLKFEPFFHSHVAEFIKGLNRKGIPGLLNLTNQTLGNPYLHSPWKLDQGPQTDVSGSGACIILGGFGIQPGNFEVVIPDGSHIWHDTHDNSSITKPWIRGQQITDQAMPCITPCITERISNRKTLGCYIWFRSLQAWQFRSCRVAKG